MYPRFTHQGFASWWSDTPKSVAIRLSSDMATNYSEHSTSVLQSVILTRMQAAPFSPWPLSCPPFLVPLQDSAVSIFLVFLPSPISQILLESLISQWPPTSQPCFTSSVSFSPQFCLHSILTSLTQWASQQCWEVDTVLHFESFRTVFRKTIGSIFVCGSFLVYSVLFPWCLLS